MQVLHVRRRLIGIHNMGSWHIFKRSKQIRWLLPVNFPQKIRQPYKTLRQFRKRNVCTGSSQMEQIPPRSDIQLFVFCFHNYQLQMP